MTSNPVRTDDGSFTFRHPEVGEAYHSLDGADAETRCKFIDPSGLRERLLAGPVRLLDVGFGLGFNCRAALNITEKYPLRIDSMEKEREALERGLMLFPGDSLILSLQNHGEYRIGQNQAVLHIGDIRNTVQKLSEPYDLIFHDPFSPVRNSECWTVELFREMFRLLKPDGVLLTYSRSKIIRKALEEAGFNLQETPIPPPRRGGTLAFKTGNGIDVEETIPFRDPALNASGHEIRSRREAELRTSRQS